MKKHLLLLLFIYFAGILTLSAHATSVTFGDNSCIWPGWGNGRIDSTDVNGIPDLLGGVAEFDQQNRLTKLTFNYTATNSSLINTFWAALMPGDLFIDLGANEVWDYVVDIDNVTTQGAQSQVPVYSFSDPYIALNDSDAYILSKDNNPATIDAWTAGGVPRENHPVAIQPSYHNYGVDLGDASFDGWKAVLTINPNFSTFDFVDPSLQGGLDLKGQSTFIVGWTVNCANDVIYEQITAPVPEPSTFLMLIFGILGMIGIRRKFRNN